MKILTLVIYALSGAGAMLGGIAAIVSPALILPGAELPPLARHLAREEGAAFVFIGGMVLWAARHYDRRRPVHLGMVVLTALFAAIHWQGYFESGHYASAAVVNTIPFVLFALTTPLDPRR